LDAALVELIVSGSAMNRWLDMETTAAEHYEHPGRRSLSAKFRSAFRGLKRAIRRESNFFVHLFVSAVTIAAAAVFRVSPIEWCLLVASIAAVFTAEMINTAIESLAKAISREYNPRIADALDIASAAVLVTALGAVVVGSLVFIPRLLPLVGG
jgi:diacylglycerol kinase